MACSKSEMPDGQTRSWPSRRRNCSRVSKTKTSISIGMEATPPIMKTTTTKYRSKPMDEKRGEEEVDMELVLSLAQDKTRFVLERTASTGERLHHALGMILAGISLLSALGLYRHVVQAMFAKYVDFIYGRMH